MPALPLRGLVNSIALAVALTITVVVPCGYFFVAYSNIAETLSFKSRLNATRVAQYIYAHDTLWQYQQVRLADLIKLPEVGEQPINQKIHDRDGKPVLAGDTSLRGPVVGRSAPIVVSGTTVGTLVIETSLSEVLQQTLLVAFLGASLGFVAYLAVRWFPMRALDRALENLRASQRDLAAQNERLDAALTNMSQGLCMFGPDEKLVLANNRFAEIYGVPSAEILPGMTTRDLMAVAAQYGKVESVDPEGTLASQRSFIQGRTVGLVVDLLTDGRSIAISHRPMPNGGFVATFEDITQRLRAEERIKYLAHYDALTDLPNRVSFYERTEAILAHLRRDESVAILSLDLDHFKNVNDTLGHPVGDFLLKQAADRMRNCVRGEDFVARLGGDEFAVVQVPSAEPPNIPALASRLIEFVGAPYEIDGRQVVVGLSVGIALAPADGEHPDVIMKNADLALYRAKADGGGTYRFFEAEMDARMQARRVLELELRRAVVNFEFELHYQPVVDVKSGRITSCEALIRWHHPERGMIPPLEFIPVAEETGLIVPIGEWVLTTACAEAARWPKDVTIAVNLSPAQFKSRNLVQAVKNALANSDLPARRLELEITELVLLQESDGAFVILHQLRDLGIRIAMDDFGTGYSSLGYLRSFPFDKIKIDKSFIQDLPGKEDSVAIVRAVVGLSSSLGITTTAEGVETKEQLAGLTSEGCDEFQGFLFSKPRSAADVEKLLRESVRRVGGAVG